MKKQPKVFMSFFMENKREDSFLSIIVEDIVMVEKRKFYNIWC